MLCFIIACLQAYALGWISFCITEVFLSFIALAINPSWCSFLPYLHLFLFVFCASGILLTTKLSPDHRTKMWKRRVSRALTVTLRSSAPVVQSHLTCYMVLGKYLVSLTLGFDPWQMEWPIIIPTYRVTVNANWSLQIKCFEWFLAYIKSLILMLSIIMGVVIPRTK